MSGFGNRLAARFCAWASAGVLALAGCTVLPTYALHTSSAQAAFDRGDYDKAVADARLAVLAQPGYAPAEALLAQAFRRSVEMHSGRIAEARRVLDWDTVVAGYRSLAEVDRQARPIFFHAPERFGVADLLVDRTEEYELALRLAAETHYQAGAVLATEPAKAQKRKAARALSKAEGYISPYKDAAALEAAAREAGTEKVALIPFEDPGSTGAGGQMFEEIRRELEAGRRQFRFVRFLPGSSSNADLAVRAVVEEVSTKVSPITDTYVHTRTRMWEDDSGKTRRQKAESRTRSRTTTVSMRLAVRIVDLASGRDLLSDTLTADAAEKQTWQEDRDFADDDERLGRAIGELVVALLGVEPRGPGPADVRALKREAGEDLAAKAFARLAAYFESL